MARRKQQKGLLSMYEGLTAEFQARIDRVGLFIRHPSVEGAAHEGVLKDFLRTYLPHPYAVSRGAMWDANTGESSGECDILVYDVREPPIYREADFIVVPPSSVRVVVEVKTTFPVGPKVWGDAIKKVRRIQQVAKTESPEGVPVFLFAFREGTPVRPGRRWMIVRNLAPVVSENVPSVICVLGKTVLLNKGAFSRAHRQEGTLELTIIEPTRQRIPAPEPFLIFFVLLLRQLERQHGHLSLGQAINRGMDAFEGRVSDVGVVHLEIV